MYLDYQNLFSNDQAITTSGTTTSTSTIDLGLDSTKLQPNLEKNAKVFIDVTHHFNALTNLTITLQSHGDTGFSTGTKDLWTQTYALAELVLGRIALFDLPIGAEQYLRLKYYHSGATEDEGTITAGLVLDGQTNGMAD